MPRECYVPNPAHTFLVEKTELECSLCWMNPLGLPADPKEDTLTPATCLLPCGHVFCSECIDSQRAGTGNRCPICRLELEYPMCRFYVCRSGQVPAVKISHSNIHNLPPVGPNGSTIPDYCKNCRGKAFGVASKDFTGLYQQYEATMMDYANGMSGDLSRVLSLLESMTRDLERELEAEDTGAASW